MYEFYLNHRDMVCKEAFAKCPMCETYAAFTTASEKRVERTLAIVITDKQLNGMRLSHNCDHGEDVVNEVVNV